MCVFRRVFVLMSVSVEGREYGIRHTVLNIVVLNFHLVWTLERGGNEIMKS